MGFDSHAATCFSVELLDAVRQVGDVVAERRARHLWPIFAREVRWLVAIGADEDVPMLGVARIQRDRQVVLVCWRELSEVPAGVFARNLAVPGLIPTNVVHGRSFRLHRLLLGAALAALTEVARRRPKKLLKIFSAGVRFVNANRRTCARPRLIETGEGRDAL